MSDQNEELPGMSTAEWHGLEGDALQGRAAETGDPSLHRQGTERHIDAIDDGITEILTSEFKRLFPGEDIPTDNAELSNRVQKGLGIFEGDKG